MKLGLLAGGGPFPLRVAQAAAAAGNDVFVVGLRDFCDDPDLNAFPHMHARIGASGTIIERLRAEGVTHVALCGKARRLSVFSLWPDAWTAKLIARIGAAAFSGDDTLLRSIVRILNEEGFTVVSPQSFLQSSSASVGLLSGPDPDDLARTDISRGIAALQSLASLDIGQAIVVQQGLVLGIEAVEGTDALLRRAGDLRRDGPGGVLIKLSKQGQEMRVDAPVVGPITIAGAAAAGLRGIAIEAERTVVADRDAMLAAAAERGLFVIAVDPAAFSP